MNGEPRPGWYFAHAHDDPNMYTAHVRRHFFAWQDPNNCVLFALKFFRWANDRILNSNENKISINWTGAQHFLQKMHVGPAKTLIRCASAQSDKCLPQALGSVQRRLMSARKRRLIWVSLSAHVILSELMCTDPVIFSIVKYLRVVSLSLRTGK